MDLNSFGITDTGKVRENNEDALFLDDAHQFYAVADGLGGLPGGAETSQRIVDLLAQTMAQVDSKEERVDLSDLITQISQIVEKEGFEAHPFTGSGSTLTACQIVGNQLLIGHVGDSAAYLLRGNELEKLTTDHTMAQELIDRRGDGALEGMPPEYPHTLTRCIGQPAHFQVDSNRVSVEPGDTVLLCTDGLNKVVPLDQIKAVLSQTDRLPADRCQQLVDMANNQKGPDNITLIILSIA